MTDELMTIKDAAAFFRTTERHIRDLHRRRVLPCVRVGRLVRFRRSDLEAYIARQVEEARNGHDGPVPAWPSSISGWVVTNG